MPQSPPIAISDRALALPETDSQTDNGMVALNAAARKAADAALDRGETHYTDRPGIKPLRALVADRLTAAGLPVEPDEVVITCGIEEARFVAVTVLGAEGPIGGNISHLAAVAALCNVPIATSGEKESATWSTGAVPQVDDLVVQELRGTGLDLPAGLAGRAGPTVILGDLPEAGVLRTGFLACSKVDPKALRDFKQALTICTTNLSQWAALGMTEETDAVA